MCGDEESDGVGARSWETLDARVTCRNEDEGVERDCVFRRASLLRVVAGGRAKVEWSCRSDFGVEKKHSRFLGPTDCGWWLLMDVWCLAAWCSLERWRAGAAAANDDD